MDVNGIEMYYEVVGAGVSVVLVHSWGTSLRVWDAVCADLAADHQVVVYDWRGCGRTERTAGGNTIRQNALDLLALCQALELDRPILVGSSVGGAFATEAVRVAAGSARGVVVIDGPGHWGSVMAGALRARRAALVADRAAAVEASVAGMYTADASPALRAWTARQILDAAPYIDVLFDEQSSYDPRPWLADMNIPIRYIHGQHDVAVPVHVAESLARLSPGAGDPTIIEGTGHLPHQERPGAVAQAIRDFARHLR